MTQYWVSALDLETILCFFASCSSTILSWHQWTHNTISEKWSIYLMESSVSICVTDNLSVFLSSYNTSWFEAPLMYQRMCLIASRWLTHRLYELANRTHNKKDIWTSDCEIIEFAYKPPISSRINQRLFLSWHWLFLSWQKFNIRIDECVNKFAFSHTCVF